jgi:hypothetical protein
MYRHTFCSSELSFFPLCFWAQIKNFFMCQKEENQIDNAYSFGQEQIYTSVSLSFQSFTLFLCTALSKVSSLEMDTFWLFHLRICLGRLFLFVLYVLLACHAEISRTTTLDATTLDDDKYLPPSLPMSSIWASLFVPFSSRAICNP